MKKTKIMINEFVDADLGILDNKDEKFSASDVYVNTPNDRGIAAPTTSSLPKKELPWWMNYRGYNRYGYGGGPAALTENELKEDKLNRTRDNSDDIISNVIGPIEDISKVYNENNLQNEVYLLIEQLKSINVRKSENYAAIAAIIMKHLAESIIKDELSSSQKKEIINAIG